jgi:tetratricopeptide (TPR) repeat protein
MFVELNGRRRSMEEAAERSKKSLDAGDLHTAIEIYDLMIEKDPNNVQIYNNRGGALHSMKRYDEALSNYDHAIAIKSDYAILHYNRGHALLALKRYDEALASYDNAIFLEPDYAAAYHAKGVLLMNSGQMTDAEAMFKTALQLNPRSSSALYSLSTVRRFLTIDDPVVRKIQTALDDSTHFGRDLDALYYALGKIYDDCGIYDQAFGYYRRANLLNNSKIIYNAYRVEQITQNIKEFFTAEFLSRQSKFGSSDESPIFIVGMPRSGTTLMASILSNHPSIDTAGELTTIAESAARLPKMSDSDLPYPQVLQFISSDLATVLIQQYQKTLRNKTTAESKYVIDKYPLNFRYLGLIAVLFPKASVIHCTRHPLDTCLSNYFSRFTLDYDYSFDLQNIAHCYTEYLKVMEYWRNALPMRLIELRYEDMVADTEQTARLALQFLGLEWDARCLAPHTNRHAVETGSNWQVRQPVYDYAMGRWRNYEKHLAGLTGLIGNDYKHDRIP